MNYAKAELQIFRNFQEKKKLISRSKSGRNRKLHSYPLGNPRKVNGTGKASASGGRKFNGPKQCQEDK